MLAARAGLEQPVVDALAHAYERWDGKGFPAGLAGDAIPLAVRVVVVARDADLARMLGDDPGAWLRERRGRAYDPAVVDAFERVGADVLAGLDGADEWEAALAREPEPVAAIGPERPRAVLTAFADFADLKSPWIRGHSRRVASLAAGGGPPRRARRRRVRRPAARGARPRSRPRRRRERDLGQAGPAHDVRVGAGAAPPVLHRADPRPVRPARAPRRAGVVAPRAPRRVGVPPLAPGRRRCRARTGCWPRRTCSPRSPPTGRTVPRSPEDEAARVLEAEARPGSGRGRLRARRRRPARGSGRRGLARRAHRSRGGGAAPDRAGRGRTARWRRASSSRRRPWGATSRTCTGRSGSRSRPPRRSSRWSTTCSTEGKDGAFARCGRGPRPHTRRMSEHPSQRRHRSTTRSTAAGEPILCIHGTGSSPCSGSTRRSSWRSAGARSCTTAAASAAASGRSPLVRTCTCMPTTRRR